MPDIQPELAAVTGIDSHAHVFPKDMPLAEGRRYAPDYDANVSLYRATLQEQGLSHGVLIQPSFLGTDNRYILNCLDRFPTQFRGVIVINAKTNLNILDAYDTQGVVGIRANLIGQATPDFTSAHWRQVLKKIADLDWHLEVQVEASRLIEFAPSILTQGVRLVIDHFGRIDPELGIDDPGFQDILTLGASKRAWVKISGVYRICPRVTTSDEGAVVAAQQAMIETAKDAYSGLKNAFGTERLVWGSDWPHTTYETSESYATVRSQLDAIVPCAVEQHALLVTTPSELFDF